MDNKELIELLTKENFTNRFIILKEGTTKFLLVLGNQHRTYKNKFSIYTVGILQNKIVYESHEESFVKKVDAYKAFKLLERFLNSQQQ